MWFRLMVLSCLALAAFADLSKERSPATVKIHHERSTDSELVASVDAFGETHHLNLEETKLSAVPLHEVTISPNGTITINDVQDDNSIRYYEDDTTGTLMYMADDNVLEGMISDSIFLTYENNGYVADKIDIPLGPFCATKDFSATQVKLSIYPNSNEANSDNKEITYYPDIISVFDSTLYKKIGSSSGLVRYGRVYWKVIDNLFRSVEGVNIYLRLRAIYYSTSTAVDNLLMGSSKSIYVTILKFASFMKKRRSIFRGHDISHLITGRNLCGSSCSVKGIVYKIGGVCKYNSYYAENTGLTEDDSKFTGAYITAHEIAHNLGSYHDGTGKCFVTIPYSGYIMDRRYYQNKLFSICSSYFMRKIYNNPSAGCLKTTSHRRYA